MSKEKFYDLLENILNESEDNDKSEIHYFPVSFLFKNDKYIEVAIDSIISTEEGSLIQFNNLDELKSYLYV